MRSTDLYVGHVRRAFERAGWSVRGSKRYPQLDLLVERAGRRYAIEIRAARESRREHLAALLADAVLRSRVDAAAADADPLAVVAAPRITRATATQLHAYAHRYLPAVAYGFVDGRGELEFSGPDLDAVVGDPDRPVERLDRRPDPHRFDLFSDLNQWLLKVLLARHLDEHWLEATREPIRNAAHLAQLATVSHPTAARLVAHLRRMEMLESSAGGLRLRRISDLLGLWTAATRRSPRETRARFALPSVDVREQLSKRIASYTDQRESTAGRVCLALFAASEQHGLAYAHGVAPHVYVEHPNASFLKQIGLMQSADTERADVIILEPEAPESIFRGAVQRGGIATCDLLQAWLDLAHHPARGTEQAKFIWKRALGPALGVEYPR